MIKDAYELAFQNEMVSLELVYFSFLKVFFKKIIFLYYLF